MIKLETALFADVYRDASGYDCTNGGESSIYKTMQVIDESMYGDYVESERSDILILVEGPRDTIRAVPINKYFPGRGANGAMFGGNFVYTGDSRFPTNYPIKIFDRVE